MLVRGSQDESHSDVATGRSVLSRCSLLAGRLRFSVLNQSGENLAVHPPLTILVFTLEFLKWGSYSQLMRDKNLNAEVLETITSSKTYKNNVK